MKIRITFGMAAIPLAAGLIFAQNQPKPAAPKPAAPAAAQPAAPTQPANAASPSAVKPVAEAQMDEVLVQANSRVTGSKTDVPVHDTPASIITVPREIIDDQMAVDMNSMVRNVSGVNPQLGGGYGLADSYTIRGLNMRFLRDGFADGAAFNGYMRTMTDVESIEVLKGPGSALYGRNEPGGAINVTTKKPQDKLHASGEAMAGFWNTYRVAADVGMPLVDNKLLTRLNTAYFKTDGYRGLSREIIEVLPTVTWNFNEKHALTLDYDFRRIKSTPDNYGILFDANNAIAAVSPSTTYYSPFNKAEQTVNRISALYEGKFSNQFKLRSALIYDTRDIFFVRNANVAVSAAGVVSGRDVRSQTDKVNSVLQQNEAVLKFLTGEIAHTVLVGLEFEYARVGTVRNSYGNITGAAAATATNLPNISLLNPMPTETDYLNYTRNAGGSFDRVLESYTYSAYAQEQITITKQIKARVGLRWDHVDAQDAGVQGTSTRTISMGRDMISWQTGAVYQPWQPVSFYAGYSEGKFIALNTEAVALFTTPESSNQLEVGNKTTFFKDRLQTNLAVFQTNRSNYPITDTSGNVNIFNGKRVTNGVELDISGNPFAGLWLIFNTTYMDAKVVGDETATVNNVRYNIDGKIPQNIPQYAGSLWATYQIQSGFFKGFGFGGGPTVKSGVYVDARNLLRIPGYIVADAVLFYKRENWQVQVNFRNITNEIYYATPTFAGALPSEPFNFTVSAKARL
jgi:iron complex outermembrane recepter protein